MNSMMGRLGMERDQLGQVGGRHHQLLVDRVMRERNLMLRSGRSRAKLAVTTSASLFHVSIERIQNRTVRLSAALIVKHTP